MKKKSSLQLKKLSLSKGAIIALNAQQARGKAKGTVISGGTFCDDPE